MIETHDLTKIYSDHGLLPFRPARKQTVAVDHLNLHIDEGQVFGLLGVNGAGKTTLVKLLATLLEPTSGTARVGGYDVVRDAGKVRRIVNMIAGGERMLYWRLTGRENLAYFADLYDVPEPIKTRRIGELLELVGLSQDADRRVEQYSKGMKQRLQIARGLINDPVYLFMDEPTIGLDAPIARQIRQFIKERLKDKTILFTSHYMYEVEELCDQIVIIHKGGPVDQGTPDQLKQKYKQEQIVVVTVDGQDAALDQVLDAFSQAHQARRSAVHTELGYQITVRSAQNITAQLFDAITATHRRILELRAVEPTLEDVLVAISGDEAK
ncbi:MAG TPA: ABC transporter ATP-binding protein [Anaerolineae bacterium]|nr:ABC transporter ATP-binding protein [Anaerolineae bacterium]